MFTTFSRSVRVGKVLRLIVPVLLLYAVNIAAAIAAGAPKAGLLPEWEKAVGAAENEGQVTIYGPPGINYQNAIGAFREAFPKIKLVYVPGSGTDNAHRLMAERRAG